MRRKPVFVNEILGKYLEVANKVPYQWEGPEGFIHEVNQVTADHASVRVTMCLEVSWSRFADNRGEAPDLWIEQGFPFEKRYARPLYRTRQPVTCLACLAAGPLDFDGTGVAT